MFELFDVNPFAEAIFYYIGRANNKCTERRLADTLRRLPTQKKALENAVKPALELEKLLDSELNVNEELLNKYFKKFECDETAVPQIPFEFCLASIMTINPLINHLDESTDSICRHLRKCSEKEKMYAFNFGLGNLREPFEKKGSQIKKFSRRLESLSLPLENKWTILNAAFNYHEHIEELLSLIIPAAKLIESEKEMYKAAQENFKKLYSDADGHALFDSYFRLKKESIDTVKVAPLFFGFDNFYAELNIDAENISGAETPPAILRTFLGAAFNITRQSPQDELLQLSEDMKTLSDKTRLEILFYLCSHRVYGQELCSKFNLHHSTVSYHLTKLMNAGFVTGELFGSKTFYSANKTGIQRMVDIFVEKIK